MPRLTITLEGVSSAFDDPDFKASMAANNIRHTPGMADRLMEQLAPLLAADGYDLDSLEESDLPGFQAALDAAVERYNMELFTAVGEKRAQVFEVLRRLATYYTSDRPDEYLAVLEEVQPDPTPTRPSVAQTIGTTLGLLDEWHRGEPPVPVELDLPTMSPSSQQTARDILELTAEGRASGELDALLHRHGSFDVLQSAVMCAVATIELLADAEGINVPAMAKRLLPPTATSQPGAAFGLGAPSSADASADSWEARKPAIVAAELPAMGDFEQWLANDPPLPVPPLADTVELIAMLFDRGRNDGINPYDPDEFLELIDLVMAAADAIPADSPEGDGVDFALPLLIAMRSYAEFRKPDAPDAWEYACDEIEEVVYELFGGGAAELPDVSSLLEMADASEASDPAKLREALNATTIVSGVGALLEWIGDGRTITESGALRRADIETVAAMIGVQASGSGSRAQRRAAASDSPVQYVRSMWEVRAMAAWWEALLASDTIVLDDTKVRRSPLCTFADGELALNDAEMLVGMFVADLLVVEPEYPELAIGTFGYLRGLLVPESEQALLPEIHDTSAVIALRQAGIVTERDAAPFITPALRQTVARGAVSGLATGRSLSAPYDM